jgi:hypothetical protein
MCDITHKWASFIIICQIDRRPGMATVRYCSISAGKEAAKALH